MILPHSSSLASGADTTERSDRNLVEHLRSSELFRDYQKAFEAATGLPLAWREAGSFQSPLQGSRRANPFCLLMAGKNQTCAACLQLQQRIENEAAAGQATLECFAGLNDSAVPVKVGERMIGYLQTGQVFLRPATEARFSRLLRVLSALGLRVDTQALKSAYFKTRVIGRPQYDSAVRLLAIFARHLSDVANQVVVKEAAAEAPEIARARNFIAERLGEEISLTEVARATNMSSFYFCKVFKRATGLTFTDYLARLRIESVKSILLSPHKRVSEAAYEAGFQSLSQFNRVFRRVAGEAPSTYRERLHGSDQGGPFSCAA